MVAQNIAGKQRMAYRSENIGDVLVRGNGYWQIVVIEVESDGFRVATLIEVEPVPLLVEVPNKEGVVTQYVSARTCRSKTK